MSCIVPERFAELLDSGGLEGTTSVESAHVASCPGCRDTWARLSSADEFLRASSAVRPRAGMSRMLAVLAAAAAVVLAVGVVFWKAPAPVRPAAGTQDPKPEPGPIVKVDVLVCQTVEDLFPKKPATTPFAARIPADRVAGLRDRMLALKLISRPSLSVLSGQEGTLFIGEQIAYDSEYIVNFDAEGVAAIEAVVGGAMNGIQLAVRPELAPGGEVQLSGFKLVFEEVAGEVAKAETPFGIIKMPQVKRVTYALKSKLARGESILVGPLRRLSDDDREDPLWALVSCSVAPK